MSDVDYMRQIAKDVEVKLPDNHGFILLTFPYGPNGILRYAASAEREDAIKVLKEFLFQIGESENWMKHIK